MIRYLVEADNMHLYRTPTLGQINHYSLNGCAFVWVVCTEATTLLHFNDRYCGFVTNYHTFMLHLGLDQLGNTARDVIVLTTAVPTLEQAPCQQLRRKWLGEGLYVGKAGGRAVLPKTQYSRGYEEHKPLSTMYIYKIDNLSKLHKLFKQHRWVKE